MDNVLYTVMCCNFDHSELMVNFGNENWNDAKMRCFLRSLMTLLKKVGFLFLTNKNCLKFFVQ
jgi:hypothetical protein